MNASVNSSPSCQDLEGSFVDLSSPRADDDKRRKQDIQELQNEIEDV